MLKSIHRHLFKGIFDESIVGEFRTYNVRKEGEILLGDTFNYANYFSIDEIYEYDFGLERKQKYSFLPAQEQILNISEFTSKIWQVHPFGKGSTRTTAVFMELYLYNKGYDVNNDLFKEYSRYFRNALVRSNFSNVKIDVSPTYEYINKFFENLICQTQHELTTKELIIMPCSR